MTNVNDNETNGIADEVTLPEGDAVAILRKYASFWGASHATHTQCDSNWEVTTMHTLADMVERDYVSREYLDEVRSEADYREGLLHESIDDLEAERDELKSRHCPHYHVDRHYCDVYETRIEALIAERDEWKAKAEQAQESYIDAKQDRDAWIEKCKQAEHAMNAAAGKWAKADAENRELRKMLLLDDGTVEEYTERADPSTALAYQKQLAEEWRDRCHNAEAWCDKLESERDEWKAKAEGSSKVRAGSSNLEWLFENDRDGLVLALSCDNPGRAGCGDCAAWKETNSCLFKREWLMAPHEDCGNSADTSKKDADCAPLIDHDLNAKVLDVLKNAPGWAKEEISDNLRKSQDSEIESCGQYADQLKCEEAPDCESDSREKLEADVRQYANPSGGTNNLGACWEKKMVGFLDRQAAITERECDIEHYKMANKSLSNLYRYYAEKAIELQSEVDNLKAQLGNAADINERQDIEYLSQCERIAELQEKVDEQRKSLEAAWEDNAELIDQLESAHAKNRALKAHISKMQEGRHGWHIKGKELQTKVDSLTQANGDLREEWHRVCAERDKLNRELHESNRERERLREQLGIAIDHAHDMIALGSVDTDEGLA